MGSLGQALGAAIITHDWTGVAGVFVNSISQALAQAGPGGALFGGLLSGIFGALSGKKRGGRGGREGQTQQDAVWVNVANHGDLATALLKATVVGLLSRAGGNNSAAAALNLRGQARRIAAV